MRHLAGLGPRVELVISVKRRSAHDNAAHLGDDGCTVSAGVLDALGRLAPAVVHEPAQDRRRKIAFSQTFYDIETKFLRAEHRF